MSTQWRSNPRSMNEKWQFYASTTNEFVLRIKVRGCRLPKHLPNSCDGYYRSEGICRSWKFNRKTQWRE